MLESFLENPVVTGADLRTSGGSVSSDGSRLGSVSGSSGFQPSGVAVVPIHRLINGCPSGKCWELSGVLKHVQGCGFVGAPYTVLSNARQSRLQKHNVMSFASRHLQVVSLGEFIGICVGADHLIHAVLEGPLWEPASIFHEMTRTKIALFATASGSLVVCLTKCEVS